MHVGNLRTALYEYLIAKSSGGSFILRVEDTDQSRYVEGAIDAIYKTLRLAGLVHDEGPDIGGPYGPYVQSERKDGYMDYARTLIERGKAYYCFCAKERLAELKAENELHGRTNAYDRRCISLDEETIRGRLDGGAEYVIRQKMPTTGVTIFHDSVYGDIAFDNAELEDQILIKSDGMPTYNFANVVDDHLMEITHVVRGSEYISSTPKYNLLYESFGWDVPVYVHLPQIVKEGGRKLSKREGDPSFLDLTEKGYLPEAIINYLALLGWSPPDNRELYTLKELEGVFSIEGIGKSPSFFDIEKLRFFNAEHIRGKTPDEFYDLALPYIRAGVSRESIDARKIAATLFKRTEALGEIPGMIGFYEEMPEFSNDLYSNKKMKTDEVLAAKALLISLPALRALPRWDGEDIRAALSAIAEENGLKNGQILWPLRIAVTGLSVTPGGAVEILEILGRDESVKRTEAALEKLKG
jgi:glutamyl-tRNA synthetase